MLNSTKRHRSRIGFFRAMFCCPSWVVAVAIFTGCGGVDHGDRVAVSGEVLVGDEPIEGSATITFEPFDKSSEEGKKAIGSIAELKNGEFKIEKSAGPSGGKKFKVSVTTFPGRQEGVPQEQRVKPKTYTGSVEIPSKGASDLKVLVEDLSEKKN